MKKSDQDKNDKIIIHDTDKNMRDADAEKRDAIFEHIRQLSEVKTYCKLSDTEIKNIISEIQTKLRNLIICHLYKGNCNCTKKMRNFCCPKCLYMTYHIFT